MTFGFVAVPLEERYVLSRAMLPATLVTGFDGEDAGEGLMRADVVIAGGGKCLQRRAQEVLPRDGRRGDHPAEAVGHGDRACRPRRRPSCSSRAASLYRLDRPVSPGRGRRARA